MCKFSSGPRASAEKVNAWICASELNRDIDGVLSENISVITH